MEFVVAIVVEFYRRTFRSIYLLARERPVIAILRLVLFGILVALISEGLDAVIPSWITLTATSVFIAPYVFAFVITLLREDYF